MAAGTMGAAGPWPPHEAALRAGCTTTAVARSCDPQHGAREPPAGPHHPQGGIMKLVIAGSCTFTDYQHLCQVLAPDRHRITQVLTGGARGADALGKRWAWSKQVPWKGFKADWERFGKSAGVRRNHQMAQAGDVLVAFWDGQSPGTAHMIQCMEQMGKPVVVVRFAGA